MTPRNDPRYHHGAHFLLSRLRKAENGIGSFFDDKAQGRVLETALTLHMLRKEGIELDWQERLREYATTHLPNADLFSTLVGEAVLETVAPGSMTAGLNQMMRRVEYAKRRKYALLAMLLVEVKRIPFEMVRVTPDAFSDEATHRFSRLYSAALRLIYAQWSVSSPDLEDDIQFILDAQGRNGGWEQQALITIVVMLGLGTGVDAFWKGLEFLKGLERPDGGIPFCDNQNVWLTALVGLSLDEWGGAEPEVREEIAVYLASRQHANGGWSFTEEVVQTDTDDSANCIQVLMQFDPIRYVSSIARGHDYLLSLQRDDGGYPTYEIEGESEVTMTANIVLVQSLNVALRSDLVPRIRAAGRFLMGRQKEDGRYEKSWSLSETYSIFRVQWALNACQELLEGVDHAAMRVRTLNYLLASQHDDGGWGQTEFMRSDALSSAYGLASLCLLRVHVPVDRARIEAAVRFIFGQQNPNTGEFLSIPDVAGPRPIPFEVPLLATTFCVLALSLVEPR